MANLDTFSTAQIHTRTRSREPLPPSVPPRTLPNDWRNRASSWLGSWVGDLAFFGRPRPSLADQLARIASGATEPEEVRMALVRLVGKASGADRVELFRERGGRSERRLACWPIHPQADPFGQQHLAVHRGPMRGPGQWARRDKTPVSTLCLPLKAGEQTLATLRLTGPPGQVWSPWVVQRLETLCAIAATAERALAVPRAATSVEIITAFAPESMIEPEVGPRGSAMLSGFLGFAMALAHRRREPLSLMFVAVDRLAAIQELLGEDLGEQAIDRVARAIKSAIRASDVIVRLEDGRLGVILPNVSTTNADKVATSIRTAITRAGAASVTMPCLTASIGIASFPEHARSAVTLRAAACSTLNRARSLGNDQSAIAPTLDDPAAAF